MDLNVINTSGASVESVSVSESIFNVEFKPALVHQIVNAYLARARAGTKAQKNRSAVSGGGAKPWRQKGTGRARSGTSRNPIWRSGGRAFAASPRNYAQKVNRKMYRGAVRSIVSELIRQDRLVVIDNLELDSPKTKQLVVMMKDLGVSDGMFVVESLSENLYLAARNLPNVDVSDVSELDPVSLLAFEKVVITSGALAKIEERLR